MKPSNLVTHIRETDDVQMEFKAVVRYLTGLCLDIGCGTNRVSPSILTVDNFPHKDADLVCDARTLPFSPERFDAVFSSHLLEDFAPNAIPIVFDHWWSLVKPGGYLVLLVPDMESGRYPKWNEQWSPSDPAVKAGQAKAGELKGNPSHRINMGLNLLRIIANGRGREVQVDTIPHTEMTLDYVLQKQAV